MEPNSIFKLKNGGKKYLIINSRKNIIKKFIIIE
jgi:hypothetical protein